MRDPVLAELFQCGDAPKIRNPINQLWLIFTAVRNTAPGYDTPPMKLPFRKKSLLWLLAVPLLAALATLGWAFYAEYEAAQKARAFCAGIKPGDAESELAQRAIAAGAVAERIRWVQPLIGPRWMAAPFNSSVPWRHEIMRHVCAVTVENGQARAARYERAE